MNKFNYKHLLVNMTFVISVYIGLFFIRSASNHSSLHVFAGME